MVNHDGCDRDVDADTNDDAVLRMAAVMASSLPHVLLT